jgi:hypothetical protein
MEDELLVFFKALVDVDRLKVIGLLALEPHTPQEMANRLNLRPVAVVRHLDYLAHAGLVRNEAEIYRLDTHALEEKARLLLAHEKQRFTPEGMEGEDFNRKVLGDFFNPDGSLKSIPAQQKKLLVVLEYIVESFEFGNRYSEKQVNEILRRFHMDTASLRRYLVDNSLLARQSGEYWRPQPVPKT